jgi:uncharacterized membrane protein (UPF0127 family)
MPRLRNVTTGEVIASNVERANGFWRRLLGFIPNPRIHPDDGLWFDECSAIHTVGMRQSIDVVFVDRSRRVLRVDRSVQRFRVAVTCSGAHAVIELGEAALEGRDLLAGDELALE